MEARVGEGHQPVRAGGFPRPGGGDIKDALAVFFDAGPVNGVEAEFMGQNPPHPSEHPALQLPVVGGVEEDDGVRIAAVVSGLLLLVNTVQGVDHHLRLVRHLLAGEPGPFLHAVPVVHPEIEQVPAVRRGAHTDAVDDYVVY